MSSTYLGLSDQTSTSHIDLLHFGLAFDRRSQHILYRFKDKKEFRQRQMCGGGEQFMFPFMGIYEMGGKEKERNWNSIELD